MPKTHTVASGECISSIAYAHGLFPETVWEHEANAELRKTRKNPNVLQPGDVLTLPDRGTRSERLATGARHEFRRRGIPEKLRLRFVDANGKARAGAAYTLTVDGKAKEGVTDGDGALEEFVPPDAQAAQLSLGGETYELELRALQPATTEAGQRARLCNLGFLDPADAEGEGADAALQAALKAFQKSQKKRETGLADDATIAALEAAHGC